MTQSNTRILLVDDDEAKRYLIARLLRAEGFDVEEALTGRDALAAAQSRPDLIVLDVKLPDMSGFDVCRRLKGERSTAHIPVLHMSATLVESKHRIEGLDAGADAYLTDAVQPAEFLATIRALLRARRAEQALLESEQRFQSLVGSVEEYAVFTCDPQGTITSWNEGVERIFGYDRECFIGKPCDVIFASQEEAARDLEHARRDGKFMYDRWHGRNDGTRFFASGILKAIRNDAGKLAGFVNIIRDETNRRMREEERAALLVSERVAREEAERANRLKDEFLATLSHELRTPLSAILGWTQLLQMSGLPLDQVEEGIRVIDRNARSQSRLIEDLLDVSRIISGNLRLSIERVHASPLIRAAVESLQTASDAKQISIDIACDDVDDAIIADPVRLQQIVSNLISNAIKFTPEHGRIDVGLTARNGSVEITVRDNGRGIDPKFLPFVFDRFRQADATSSRAQSGLGLGLAIVRHLVELHGGKVTAESEGVGRGASFLVLLPRAGAAGAAPRVAAPGMVSLDIDPANETTPDLRGLVVLIVDDDSDGRDLLKRLLTHCGAQVVAAGSAAEAVAAFNSLRPHIIVSDIGLPGEDGYSLIRRIHELNAGHPEPIRAIALTAFAQESDRDRALSSGFSQYLSKPIVPPDLLAAIARLSSRGALHRG